MASLEDLARGLLALISPLFGERATGSVTLSAAAGQGSVVLDPGLYLVPLVGGELQTNFPIKLARAPVSQANKKGQWTVEEGGTAVELVANLGGQRGNLPAGTRLVWDPRPPEGLAGTEVVLAQAMTGGADRAGDRLLDAAIYESLGDPLANLEMFSAAIVGSPAVLVVWGGSVSSEGSSVPAQSRGASRLGPGSQAFKEDFELFFVSTNSTSDPWRRGELLRLMDEATQMMFDRGYVDGVPLSTPDGVQIRSRGRVTARGERYSGWYIYRVGVSATRVYSKRDARTYNPWLRTTVEAVKPDAAGDQVMADVEFDNPHGEFSDAYGDEFTREP